MREQLGEDAPPNGLTQTIETNRVADDTVVAGMDEEVLAEEADDEFASYFSLSKQPKVMITTQYRPSAETRNFARELRTIIPRSETRRRPPTKLNTLCATAAANGYTDLICIGQTHATPTRLIITHLPAGPTVTFRVSSFVPAAEIDNVGIRTAHAPELFVKNFTTRLGRRVARVLHALFPPSPALTARSVASFWPTSEISSSSVCIVTFSVLAIR